MEKERTMPELYPDAVEGPYTVPSGTDIADGPQAFRDLHNETKLV